MAKISINEPRVQLKPEEDEEEIFVLANECAADNLVSVCGILVPIDQINPSHMGMMTPEETQRYYEKQKK